MSLKLVAGVGATMMMDDGRRWATEEISSRSPMTVMMTSGYGKRKRGDTSTSEPAARLHTSDAPGVPAGEGQDGAALNETVEAIEQEVLEPSERVRHREARHVSAASSVDTSGAHTRSFRIEGLRAGAESFRGMKDVNEDRHVAELDQFPGPVFGVLDGHGGSFTVDYLVRHLIKSIAAAMKHQVGGSRMDAIAVLQDESIAELARREALSEQQTTCTTQLQQMSTLADDSIDGDSVGALNALKVELLETMEEVEEAIKQIDEVHARRHKKLEDLWDQVDAKLRTAITEGFQRTDSQILQKNPSRDGSTAVLVWLAGHPMCGLRLYAINLGDSRAVLCRGGKALALTKDHKPSVLEEKQRVIKAGGFVGVFHGISRVYAAAGAGLSVERVSTTYLAVSRAFGNRPLKIPTPCVSIEPEIKSIRLQEEDAFIVLATDGVWDVLTNQEAVEIAVRCRDDPKAAADLIVKEAYQRGSNDNITASVVYFPKPGRQARVFAAADSQTANHDIHGVPVTSLVQDTEDSNETEELDMFDL